MFAYFCMGFAKGLDVAISRGYFSSFNSVKNKKAVLCRRMIPNSQREWKASVCAWMLDLKTSQGTVHPNNLSYSPHLNIQWWFSPRGFFIDWQYWFLCNYKTGTWMLPLNSNSGKSTGIDWSNKYVFVFKLRAVSSILLILKTFLYEVVSFINPTECFTFWLKHFTTSCTQCRLFHRCIYTTHCNNNPWEWRSSYTLDFPGT